jgi:hypothetical protein
MNLRKKGLTMLMQLGVLFVLWVSGYAIKTCVKSHVPLKHDAWS